MKYLIRQSSLLLVLGLFVLAAPVQAQEFRLGFVSLDRIIKEAVPAKAAQAKLEQEFSKREKELQELGANLKGLNEKLEREALTLADSERVRRQKQLM